ncbi:hypothetical protein [Pelagicoccus sp. SDUM812003]|uniref:DUF6941 family protein n=1 Tax=Pelagicoccus sp. SDUM812003 TaxID=3041267 RepID=UPI00280DC3C3|nr:hypothetical protein [Pelagicoccus sp. SDUM812003]MDQ8203907.1 hypothetical protein [Pelagicoccus sp. SDUM812003]
MQVEIFSICDAAADYAGRLNLLGAFEGMASSKAPIVRERCSIAVRMRFMRDEGGPHPVAVRIVDNSGKAIASEMTANVNVRPAENRASCAINLVLNISRLVFPAFGSYEVQLWLDGEKRSSLPLLVAKKVNRGNRLRDQMEN